MKKILVSVALFGALVSVGCSSPCDALSDTCAKCTDSSTKTSCQNAANSYKSLPAGAGSSSCQAILDSHIYDNCK